MFCDYHGNCRTYLGSFSQNCFHLALGTSVFDRWKLKRKRIISTMNLLPAAPFRRRGYRSARQSPSRCGKAEKGFFPTPFCTPSEVLFLKFGSNASLSRLCERFACCSLGQEDKMSCRASWSFPLSPLLRHIYSSHWIGHSSPSNLIGNRLGNKVDLQSFMRALIY